MAELHVQPKKNTNWWIWLLIAAAVIALVFFLMKGCGSNTHTETTAMAKSDSSTTGVAATTPNTDTMNSSGDIDFRSPAMNYDEITDKDISIRGKNGYAIYSLGNNVLFDVDQSKIRPDGEVKLKQITSSLTNRFPDADVSIYGHTDATGDAAHNKELSQKRAESVKNWITKNSTIKEGIISLHFEGENNPVASNATEEGKQANRNVEIVARPR